MAKGKVSAQEKKWQAEDDARTLMAAVEIQTSKRRMSAAKRELNNQAKAIKKAARISAGSLSKKRK